MTEIQKITKYSLLAYGIVCLMFGVLVIFLYDFYFIEILKTGWTNPYHPRMFGGVLLVAAIFAFLIFFKKDWDWEKIKLTYEVMYSLIIINIIMEGSLLALYGSTLSNLAVSQNILDLIIMSILLAVGAYSYIKQKG